MKKISIALPGKYDVFIGGGLLREAGPLVSGVLKPCMLCLVSDETVYGLYGTAVTESLARSGFDVRAFVFPPGEKSKNMNTLNSLLEFMASEKFSRSDCVAALGGGVTGDLAGFAASCYLRGVPFVQMPTTLLSAVDSSVGGKTGVNLAGGKNLAGAFWQPSLVICDCRAFDTLPKEAMLDGLAEIIKYGVIADRNLFDFIQTHNIITLFQNNLLERVIEKCVIIKSRIVTGDEFDTGKRQLLNFGHTFGHAIERLSGYEISHGHAVALGMFYVSRAAYLSGLSPSDCSAEIGQALKRYGFDLSCGYSADEIYEAALIDKKRSGSQITLVVPYDIGDSRLEKVGLSEFFEFVGRGF